MAIKTIKEALATHLGWEYGELKDYNYQPGRFSRSVYSVGDRLYCCAKDGQSLPQPTRKNMNRVTWIEIKDDYLNKQGFKIYADK
jgi:hypothetical protein